MSTARQAGAGDVRFEFSTAGRIIFGPGTLQDAAGIAAGFGRRPLVVTGKSSERVQPLLALLGERGSEAVTFTVAGEPDVDTVRRGTATAQRSRCDCVVGFGGGAVLDAAKAIAILATNPGDIVDYLEIIGHGRRLTQAPLPLVAIPTTAGTGSEVTRNSVILSREHRLKASLRSPLMLPKVAVVDPELTYCLPPAITAATGIDALTQVIEPFVCTRANPLTDGICEEGMRRAARSLRRAYESAQDAQAPAGTGVRNDAGAPVGAGEADHATATAGPPAAAPAGATALPLGVASSPPSAAAAAREDMAVASLFGGLALANAGLGAVHGIAGPLGGMVEAPHGAVCAALLPPVVAANIRALRERLPESPALARYARVARLLSGDLAAGPEDAVECLKRLVADLRIPGLAAYGVGPTTVPELVEKAARASSMTANPVELTLAELAAVVEAAM